MNSFKKAGIMLLALSILLYFCACKKAGESKEKEDAEALAGIYLDTIYNIDCIPTKYTNNSECGFKSVELHSTDYGRNFEVRICREKDGTTVCRDNYYHLYMKRDAEKYFSDLLPGGYNGCARVRFLNNVWSDQLYGAKTFAEWVATGKCRTDVFYITNIELSESQRNAIVDGLAQNKISGNIFFYTTDDKALLVDVALDEIIQNDNELLTAKDHQYIGITYVVSRKPHANCLEQS